MRDCFPFVLMMLLVACPPRTKVDEGGVDTGLGPDDTGVEDCAIASAGTVPVDSACTYVPPVGAFNFRTEWAMSTFSEYPDHVKSYASPMVGQLTDDNGDGVINDLDVPDIVAIFDSRDDWNGVLRVISGDGTGSHVAVYDQLYNGTKYHPYRYAIPALGDATGDGEPDIALTAYDGEACFLALADSIGQFHWVLESEALPCRSHAPAMADMDGNGDVEVVMGAMVVDGKTGILLGKGRGGSGYHVDYFNSGFLSVPVDLDGDGIQELVAGSHVYDLYGNTVCETGYADGYPAVADLDMDGQGEFIVTGNESVRIFETDCSLIKEFSTAGYGYGGPATIADFDGDGWPEFTVADKSRFSLYEVDGTQVWSIVTTEWSSGATASSVFDFDGDGAAEVVYGDQLAMYVLDGASGGILLADPSHTSGTVHEYPVIADVDGDGNAEILVTNSEAESGLYLVGEADDNWVGARMLWNQHTYNIVNIDEGLVVPQNAAANWPQFNSFRQGAPGSLNPQGSPDLVLVGEAMCQEDCGQPVAIAMQLANQGLVRVGAGTRVALFGVDAAGEYTLLAVETIDTPLRAGESAEGIRWEFDLEVLLLFEKVVGIADDFESDNECDESNNIVELDVTTLCE